jgi:hypothetical protein
LEKLFEEVYILNIRGRPKQSDVINVEVFVDLDVQHVDFAFKGRYGLLFG